MDINANSVPTLAPVKNSNVQQNGSHTDENQAPALPFQAVLDNQPPAPRDGTVTPSLDENTINKELVDSKLVVAGEKAAEPVSELQKNAENTIEQLNFSRNLRTDSVQTALNADLLTTPAVNEQSWLNHLKQSLSNQAQLTTKPLSAPEPHPILGAFSQRMQQLNQGTHDGIADEGNDLEGSQLQLAGEDDAPALGAFLKNEKEERRDQPLFALNQQRDVRGKNLTEDFMPLNKKVSDKAPQTDVQTLTTQFLSQTAKGAFTLQTETGAFTTNASLHTSTQPISMMPTASTAQAAAMATPSATPTMHLTSQLGSEVWQQQLSQHMLFFSRQGVSQAQIRLHPEELGSLNVHLRIEDNQAVMHFVSPHSHVRAAMESMMPVLRSALQESGIHLAQGSVGQENLNHQSDGSQHGSQQGLQQHDGHIQVTHPSVGVVGISEANATVSTKTPQVRQGGISTFA